MPETVTMDKIVAFCKRRGFVYQSSEIYGGIRSSYDYGPLGVEMKRNIKEEWWRRMVHMREDMVGLDSAIIMHPKVWEASGHTATFNDMLVESRTSKRRYRADHLIEDATGIDAEGLSPEQLTRIIEKDERVKDPADGGRDFAPVRPMLVPRPPFRRSTIGPDSVNSSVMVVAREWTFMAVVSTTISACSLRSFNSNRSAAMPSGMES